MRVSPSGAPKEAPRRTEGLLGPCDPKQTLATQKKTKRRGSESLRPRRAIDPLPSLGQGEQARPPAGRLSCDQVQGPLETCEARKHHRTGANTTKRENKRPQTESRANALAASRPRKRPQRSPERIQKTRGAQNGTPKKPQNRNDARPEQANKPMRRGLKKNKQHVRGGECGVLLDLIFLS